MTPNDFLKIIQEETCPIDKVPDGWYSTEQLSEMWGISKSVVQAKINFGKKFGYVTQKKFIIKKNGKRAIPYYKFHEKENNQKNNQRKNMENTNRSCRKN